MPRLVSVITPTLKDLRIYLHGNLARLVGGQSGIYDLVHPGDHNLFGEPRHLLGLILRALDYQRVVAGD
jgi:hypothetical protein